MECGQLHTQRTAESQPSLVGMGASWQPHPSGAWLVGILALVTPFRTWQGPFNICTEKLKAKPSQKSMFLGNRGQGLKMTPVDLRNKSIKNLWVYKKTLMLDRKPVNHIELDTTNKTKLSGFPTRGIGEREDKRLTSLHQAGFCGFVLGPNSFPLSAGEKGKSEVHRMK